MATLASAFDVFLTEIRPTAAQLKEMRAGYRTLRKRLREDDDLDEIYVADFLQGSYRRSTAIRPAGDECSDVDLVVVTNLDSASVKPSEVQDRFVPFVEKHYPGRWEHNGRSIGIKLSYVELDLVVTAAPSEAAQRALRWDAVRTLAGLDEIRDLRMNEFWVAPEHRDEITAESRLLKAMKEAEWKSEPLLIPDRDVEEWEQTHPLAQIEWTFRKNAATNRHYVNVVKAIKWWWRTKNSDLKYPKGYPLEHIVGDTCSDGIDSVARGLVTAFEGVRDGDEFKRAVAAGGVPALKDRGTDNNVLKRLSVADFKAFYDRAGEAADEARAAYEEDDPAESARLWGALLGPKFPELTGGGDGTGSGGSGPSIVGGGYSPRSEEGSVSRGRFA